MASFVPSNDVFSSVVPTRYFLGRPETGQEMHISIEKGKMLIICLMAVGPLLEGRAQREVWFELNGEVGHLIADILRLFLSAFFISFVQSQWMIRTLLSKRYPVRRLLQIPDLSALPCPVLWSK
jgi:hypothetical protein